MGRTDQTGQQAKGKLDQFQLDPFQYLPSSLLRCQRRSSETRSTIPSSSPSEQTFPPLCVAWRETSNFSTYSTTIVDLFTHALLKLPCQYTNKLAFNSAQSLLQERSTSPPSSSIATRTTTTPAGVRLPVFGYLWDHNALFPRTLRAFFKAFQRDWSFVNTKEGGEK